YLTVTGVQTCALPIFGRTGPRRSQHDRPRRSPGPDDDDAAPARVESELGLQGVEEARAVGVVADEPVGRRYDAIHCPERRGFGEIGRASCRERVQDAG